MSLTLTQNPIPSDKAYGFFAGFKPIEFKFKREDLEVVDVESGSGGITINVGSDLTGVLFPGDTIYLYSEGEDYTYDGTGEVLSITATDITINLPFIQAATGGYVNYKKNYFVEMMLVDSNFSDANKLPFTLQSDGDAAGNISIDVSVINDLNRGRGDIADGLLTKGVQAFEVKYREPEGSYTLIDNKLLIVLYALETPELDTVLNSFDEPEIYLGYPASLVVAHKGVNGSNISMSYKELDVNEVQVGGDNLPDLASTNSGLFMWKIPSDISLNNSTDYLEFELSTVAGTFDFAEPDFAFPDFLTQ